MEDQRVKYETAILAQSKGFEEKGEDFYTTNKELCAYMFSFSNTYMCEAPNQGLLQKWLREVHNIYVEIRLENSKDSIRFYVIIWNNPKGNHNTSSYTLDHMCDKYEIALEAGLFQALKLLK